jgi:hypothetical protein
MEGFCFQVFQGTTNPNQVVATPVFDQKHQMQGRSYEDNVATNMEIQKGSLLQLLHAQSSASNKS